MTTMTYTERKTASRASGRFYDIVSDGESRRPYLQTSRQTYDLPDGRRIQRFTACTDTITQVFTLVLSDKSPVLYAQVTRKEVI